ncbi:phage tail tape measure C-terminal domain-containing protein [Azospirillum brasilense]|uniref:phage tail tape measure C-terminal domain-containing protein n=1 Tax=Azospirillum brasilense TaxID=192 RepID=UPI000E6A7EF0|nr:phage tail tape measure C-terminal domain-containing protein [Azospirillum brasilense]NUB28216.1 hypothetical protein [Azospirillum brasilense]NUB33734.1 hypothetical protein [Azospirillum brasilense]RIW04444.1 hypothetical protein D2T81_10820 [Azospirillum brasilense]
MAAEQLVVGYDDWISTTVRATKSGEQLARQYGDVERLTTKVTAITSRFADELTNLEASEHALADKERLRAVILAQQDAAVRKATAAHERWVAGMRAAEAAADAQAASTATATASAGSWAGAMAKIHESAAQAAANLNGPAFEALSGRIGDLTKAQGSTGSLQTAVARQSAPVQTSSAGEKRDAPVAAAAKPAAANDSSADPKKAEETVNNAGKALAETLGKAFDKMGDALVKAFVTGKMAALDWGKTTKAIIGELAVDLVKMAAIQPLKNAFFGTNGPTLWGAFGTSGNGAAQGGYDIVDQANGMATNYAKQQGALWVGDKLGLTSAYNSVMNTTLWGAPAIPASTFTAGYVPIGGMSAGGSVYMPSMTVQQMQMANLAGVNGGTTGATIGANGSQAAAGTTVGGVLGAAGGGFAAGSLFGGWAGTQSNSKVVGAGAGALSGAAAGAAYGSVFPGIGTLAGAVVGAVAGALGGGIGTQKASVGPNAAATLRVENGKLVRIGADADNGGSTDRVVAVTDAVATAVNAMTQLGVQVREGQQYFFVDGGPKVVNNGKRAQTPEAFIREVMGTLTADGLVGKALASDAAQNSGDLNKIVQGLSLAKSIEQANSALSNLDNSLHAVQKSAFAATAESLQPMVDQFRLAQEFGLEADYASMATGQLTAILDNIRDPVQWQTVQVAVAELDGQMAAFRDQVGKVNPALVGLINDVEAAAKEKIYGDYRKTFDAGLNSARGADYLNQLTDVRTWWNNNWANSLMSGRNPNDMYAAQAKAIFDGLDVNQLGKAVEYFAELDPVMSGLAAAARDIARQDSLAGLDQRYRAVQVALGQLSQAEFDRYQIELEQARELSAVTDPVVRARLQEVQTLEKQAQAYEKARQSGESLTDWLTNKLGTSSAGVSASTAYTNALSAYQSDLAKAAANDNDALGRMASTADRLLTAYTDYFGSQGATAFWQKIMGEVANLPAVKSYDSSIVDAINRLPHGAGGPATGLTMVNDAGPELIRLPTGSMVMTSRASVDFLRRGGGTTTTMPAPDTAVVETLRQLLRAVVFNGADMTTVLEGLKDSGLRQEKALAALRGQFKRAGDAGTLPGRAA